MEFRPIDPPRRFTVGLASQITLSECAHIQLNSDEIVTFKTDEGGEYDIAKKDWGFYATPSVNGRLLKFGIRTALCRNSSGQVYVMLVEKGKDELFAKYLEDDKQELICWLSSQEDLDKLSAAFAK